MAQDLGSQVDLLCERKDALSVRLQDTTVSPQARRLLEEEFVLCTRAVVALGRIQRELTEQAEAEAAETPGGGAEQVSENQSPSTSDTAALRSTSDI
jgi:hypothetical protein